MMNTAGVDYHRTPTARSPTSGAHGEFPSVGFRFTARNALIVMVTVPAVHEDVHQGTCCQEQKRQVWNG